jgi:hypothetical protein
MIPERLIEMARRDREKRARAAAEAAGAPGDAPRA